MKPSDCFGVILVGIEGAGKTRLSRLIAKRLGWQAADADDLLPIGIDLTRARRTKNEKALSERKRQVRSLVFSKPPERVVFATTMRPLAGLINDAKERIPLKKQLEEHWIVVHIETDLEYNAEFFSKNIDARATRSRLKNLTEYREIYQELVELKKECDPYYSDFANEYVTIKPESEADSIARILSAVVCVLFA